VYGSVKGCVCSVRCGSGEKKAGWGAPNRGQATEMVVHARSVRSGHAPRVR